MQNDYLSLSDLHYDKMDDTAIKTFEKNLNHITFTNREQNARHNPFDQEQREMAAIRSGNIHDLKTAWKENYSGKIGKLAETPLRQAKNHAIVLVSIASRTALNSGVQPETGYSLSDLYIQQIEQQLTPESAFLLGRQAEYHFTRLVSQVREISNVRPSKDPRIDDIKQYIFSHLHEKIRLDAIASSLYLTKTYLCDLFKKETGTTLGMYITSQKLQAVINMLIYTDYTYSEIASYYGFSSQSHLGQQFRQFTGMTLREYRLKHRRKED